MKLQNLKIGTILKTGFAFLILFVIVIGFISYQQSDEMYQQTEDMYKHPLQVRRSIGKLTANVHAIRVDMKNIFLASEKEEIEADLNNLELLDAHAFKQIEVLRERYLGPVSDVDSLESEYIKWKSIRAEIIRLHQSGEIQEGASQTKTTGIGGRQAEVVIRSLKKLSTFATRKEDELYANSRELNNALNNQLLILIAGTVLLSLLVSWFLLRAMRKPIDELLETTERFQKGDFTSRSTNTSRNEFGVLSNSFNALADDIQANFSLSDNIENIAKIMLSEDDTKLFSQKTLHAISQATNSQIAAVYLLSDDKKTYEHFESIGLDRNARQSFTVEHFEGEFGSVLSSHKLHHIKNIPEDTRFTFHTVSGKFIPREILTIPITTTSKGTIAIISLASLGPYSKQSIQLIDKILTTFSARVEGLLAYRKIKEFSAKLEVQNSELEASQRELSSQAAELSEQNTELELQKKELYQASQMKTAFLSNMSHELRTPLNSVIALSGVLYKRLANKIPEDEYSYLEVINRNGKNLLNLINDVLDIARIEAGHEDIEVSNFNCNHLIDELVNSQSLEAKQKKIKLIHSKTDTALSITSDIKKCRHILQNLISNAVKFTEEGKVEVTSKQIDKNIVVTVIDTGIGISEDQLAHIFDEFKQADSSTSRKYGGTGLGLAIAKKYTNMLGGSISVKSEPGKGSEFTLTLPIKYTGENSIVDEETFGSFNHRTQSSLDRIPDKPDKTILLVDDSEPALIQVKDILEDRGYHVLLAHDGSETLSIIGHKIPDAMILDLMMPGIDGFHVLKSIREKEQTCHLPVLILTAKHITKEELKSLKQNQVQQLIQKGDVNANELLRAIANLLFPETLESDTPKPEPQKIEGKPVVLIVEDNPDNMLSAKALLSDDFTVLEAVNGIEGVKKAKKFKPNLILMDITLPQMDGIEAFKKIKNDPKLQHTKVIALTAIAMTQERETLLAQGFAAFIPKPIDEQQFLNTINGTLYGK